MTQQPRTSSRLVALVAALLVVAVIVFGALIIQDFNRALEPELEHRASLIGATVRDDVERALDLRIPLDGLVGTEPYFEALLEDFEELDYVAIRDEAGLVLHAGGDAPEETFDPESVVARTGSTVVGNSLVSRYSLIADGEILGSIDVGVDAGFVRSKLEDLALDLMVIVIVALVVAYEVALAASERVAGRGGRLRSGVADVRVVLFVFVIAEELSKSFLPQFILGTTGPEAGLDPALAVSLPIMAYLLTLGLTSPFGGRLTARLGERRLLMVGLSLAAMSHAGMVFATDLPQVIVLRGLTGVGYAISTIACLEYFIGRGPGTGRIRAMGAFVAVVIGGTFAGTALGGILADRLGYRPVFAISVVMIIAAAALAWRLLSAARLSAERDESEAVSLRDIVTVLRQPRLVALLAGVTVPMNVLLAAFLWYLVPLTLAAAGESAAVIGRTLMLYYLAVLLSGPAVSRLAESRVDTQTLVGIGALVSGVVLILPATELTTLTVSIAVVVVGLGHAAIRGPQLVLAIEIGEDEGVAPGRGATLAAMRTLERLGSLVGLLVAAVIAAQSDLLTAMAVVGVAVALAGAAYLGSVLIVHRSARHA